jgi:hypothetical protein
MEREHRVPEVDAVKGGAPREAARPLPLDRHHGRAEARVVEQVQHDPLAGHGARQHLHPRGGRPLAGHEPGPRGRHAPRLGAAGRPIEQRAGGHRIRGFGGAEHDQHERNHTKHGFHHTTPPIRV